MKNEVIYGEKPINANASYVELIRKDDNKLTVDICIEGSHSVCNLVLKDESCYEPFKAALIQDLNDCVDEYGIGILIDAVQAMDYHEKWIDYDDPAWNTEVCVSMDEIDEYISEVETRLLVHYERSDLLTDLSDKPATEIKQLCKDNNVQYNDVLDGESEDYWRGVLATLRWITMGSEKHDSDVLG